MCFVCSRVPCTTPEGLHARCFQVAPCASTSAPLAWPKHDCLSLTWFPHYHRGSHPCSLRHPCVCTYVPLASTPCRIAEVSVAGPGPMLSNLSTLSAGSGSLLSPSGSIHGSLGAGGSLQFGSSMSSAPMPFSPARSDVESGTGAWGHRVGILPYLDRVPRETRRVGGWRGGVGLRMRATEGGSTNSPLWLCVGSL